MSNGQSIRRVPIFNPAEEQLHPRGPKSKSANYCCRSMYHSFRAFRLALYWRLASWPADIIEHWSANVSTSSARQASRVAGGGGNPSSSHQRRHKSSTTPTAAPSDRRSPKRPQPTAIDTPSTSMATMWTPHCSRLVLVLAEWSISAGQTTRLAGLQSANSKGAYGQKVQIVHSTHIGHATTLKSLQSPAGVTGQVAQHTTFADLSKGRKNSPYAYAVHVLHVKTWATTAPADLYQVVPCTKRQFP
jgi:hypothetical protein